MTALINTAQTEREEHQFIGFGDVKGGVVESAMRAQWALLLSGHAA